MGWINEQQFDRDHRGLRNVCAADGHEGTAGNPLGLSKDGSRVHRSHFADPTSGFYGEEQGDDSRWAMTYPRGIDPLADNLSPTTDRHAIAVYGHADRDRRQAEADRAGVTVTWRPLNNDTDEA